MMNLTMFNVSVHYPESTEVFRGISSISYDAGSSTWRFEGPKATAILPREIVRKMITFSDEPDAVDVDEVSTFVDSSMKEEDA